MLVEIETRSILQTCRYIRRTPGCRGFRYLVEIISHGVWLYFRFPLSFRKVQEMMLQRGIVVSHETIWQWCVKFGQTYADGCVAVGPAIRGTSTR